MQVIAAGALELWVVRLRCALNCPQIRALGGVLRVFVLFSRLFVVIGLEERRLQARKLAPGLLSCLAWSRHWVACSAQLHVKPSAGQTGIERAQ